MHVSSVSASFRHGMTIESSIAAAEPAAPPIQARATVRSVTIAMVLLRWKLPFGGTRADGRDPLVSAHNARPQRYLGG